MEFVDKLFEFYRDRLTGEEEDAEIIVASLLGEMEREDVLDLIQEMDDEELYGLIGFYLIKSLKARIAKEELNENELPKFH
ncbi:DUF6154 family protein [Ectobacillus panaciterrae]|uniref:DUF6154 family protein n=1 Tax=Ectobacillus panaciterrae TaxID=363872 RepID=UPI0004011070|nr:DUF6154 family protein [Ectobacillus panaciterrae]